MPTVADGFAKFFDEYCPARVNIGRMRATTARDYRYQAKKHILPALGSRQVADVHREHVDRMVLPLVGVTRNRVLALTSRVFNLFEAWGGVRNTRTPAAASSVRRRSRETACSRPLNWGGYRGFERCGGAASGAGRRYSLRGSHGPPDTRDPGHPLGAHRLRTPQGDVARNKDGPTGSRFAECGGGDSGEPAAHQLLGVYDRTCAPGLFAHAQGVLESHGGSGLPRRSTTRSAPDTDDTGGRGWRRPRTSCATYSDTKPPPWRTAISGTSEVPCAKRGSRSAR